MTTGPVEGRVLGADADRPALGIPGRLRRGVLDRLVARDVWRAGPDACWARL